MSQNLVERLETAIKAGGWDAAMGLELRSAVVEVLFDHFYCSDDGQSYDHDPRVDEILEDTTIAAWLDAAKELDPTQSNIAAWIRDMARENGDLW